MSIKLYEKNSYEGKERAIIAANSLALTDTNFVSITTGFVWKATASTKIVWVNNNIVTFAADNQTVALAKVNYTPKECNVLYTVTITGWTVTQADEGKFYNLSTSILVDWTTESTVPNYVDTTVGAAVDAVISMQLELVKFVSATSSIFKIVNL